MGASRKRAEACCPRTMCRSIGRNYENDKCIADTGLEPPAIQHRTRHTKAGTSQQGGGGGGGPGAPVAAIAPSPEQPRGGTRSRGRCVGHDSFHRRGSVCVARLRAVVNDVERLALQPWNVIGLLQNSPNVTAISARDSGPVSAPSKTAASTRHTVQVADRQANPLEARRPAPRCGSPRPRAPPPRG